MGGTEENAALSPQRAAAEHVAAGLAKLGLVQRTQAWQARGRTGLTPTQAQILAQLLAAHPEPLMLRDLASGVGVTSATASESLDALVVKGLALRERSRADGRALAVRLTEAGRVEARAGAARPDPLLAAAAELDPDEQAVVLRALTKMIRHLQLERRISVARMCATCRYFRPDAHPDHPDEPHHCALVDAPFGDRRLRIDCPEHEPASPETAQQNWRVFAG
jgi:DNA-binding MarR family transcriptional regulator